MQGQFQWREAGIQSAWRPAARIFLFAALLRLLLVWDYVGTDFYHCPILDQLEYLDNARHLAQGGTFLSVWRAPLYVHFVALVLRLGGGEPVAVMIVQAILSAFTAVIVFGIGRRLFGSVRGLASGIIYSVHWSAILFCAQIVPVTLFIFFVTAGLYFLVCKPKSAVAIGLAGACGGLAALTRPTILPVIVAWAVWLLTSRARTASVRQALRAAALYAACAALVVCPALFRGKDRWGGLVPLSGLGGYNLFVGNNPASDGKTVWASEEALYQAAVPVTLEPAQYSQRYVAKVMQFVLQNPAAEAGLVLRKLYYLINGHRISSTYDIELVETSLPAAWRLWASFPVNGLLWPLAAIGLFGVNWRVQPRGALLVYVVLYGLIVIVFFVNERFRLPLVPALSVLAVAGAAVVGRAVRARRKGMLLLMVLLLLISNSSFLGVADPADKVELDIRHAWAFFVKGRVAAARAAAARVRRVRPDHPQLRRLEVLLKGES